MLGEMHRPVLLNLIIAVLDTTIFFKKMVGSLPGHDEK